MKSPVIVDLLGTGLKTQQTKLLVCVNHLIRWHITSPQWRQKYDGGEKVCHALRKLLTHVNRSNIKLMVEGLGKHLGNVR